MKKKVKLTKLVTSKGDEPAVKTYNFPGSNVRRFLESEAYQRMLLDKRWIEKRDAILKRDNYQCQNCGCKCELHVHHRQYHYSSQKKCFNKPWDYDDGYLITLCEKCHELGHLFYKVKVFIY